MRLLTRHKRPPGGWYFTEEETGWTASASNGARLVDLIIDHRKANNIGKPKDTATVWEELEAFTCNRLRGKKTLWSFCETRFPMPVAQKQFPASKPVRVASVPKRQMRLTASTQPQDAGTTKTPCKTCGGRKKKR